MHRRPRFVLGLATGLVLALLAVFAWLIVDTHATAREDVEQRFADRAKDAAGSVQALFTASFGAGQEQNAERFGGTPIDQGAIERQAALGRTPYLAVLDARGEILGIAGPNAGAARERLEGKPPEVAAVTDQDAPLMVSDVLDGIVPGTPIIAYANAFPIDREGTRRIIAAGVPLALMNAFLAEFLGRTPNPERARALTVDSNARIVGGPNVRRPGGRPDADLVEAFRDEVEGRYGDRHFTSAAIPGTTWRVIFDVEQAELYSSISGARQIVPWLVWAAFLIACLAALYFLRRAMDDARRIERARAELEDVNDALAASYERLTERAAALQRSNEELEQFASIASHDLREPLRKVQAFGEQLELRYGDALPEEGKDHLRRMRDASQRMQVLIDDLLQFARITTKGSPFRPVDLDKVLAEVLGDLSFVIEEAGATVEADALPTIDADPLQMRQLLQNLISNAVKFRKPDVAPVIRVRGDRRDDEVTLTVQDNGIGFDERYAERIFGVFKRLHGRSDYPGTGIGLALCRKIAERHGGTIEAHGTEGVGARFTVTLPARHADAGGDAAPDDREAVAA